MAVRELVEVLVRDPAIIAEEQQRNLGLCIIRRVQYPPVIGSGRHESGLDAAVGRKPRKTYPGNRGQTRFATERMAQHTDALRIDVLGKRDSRLPVQLALKNGVDHESDVLGALRDQVGEGLPQEGIGAERQVEKV